MSDDHGEIWDYIMGALEEAAAAGERFDKLAARVAKLETRLHDHEQAVPHAESAS